MTKSDKWGWEKNVEEAKLYTSTPQKLEIKVCNFCAASKYPYAIIFDGQEALCPHLFAQKAMFLGEKEART